jgi:site-specific recombinase XerD
MPTVNFYLKKAEGSPLRSLIYLQMRYRGDKFVYSLGENIDPKDWDKDKQQVKTRSHTTKDGKVHLNSLMTKIKEVCLASYNSELGEGRIPSKVFLKGALDNYLLPQIKKNNSHKASFSFFQLVDQFISGDIGDRKSAGTIKTYQTAKKHLVAFEKSEQYPLSYDSINLQFKYKYVKFLGKDKGFGSDRIKGLSQNSIGKEIKNVRTFMNMAVELGYTTNMAFKSKKFGVKNVATDAVYLSEKELRNLYKHDFSDNKRLEAVRDLFVFSSFVGLRYSDASVIKPENIVNIDGEVYIKITSKKTGTQVTIPCNDIVLSIFEKYKESKNRLPPAISGQKYNDYLKDLCLEAGLTEAGRLSTDLSRPLYQCISSHTARRNFATNCYLAGMDTRMIRMVTGHATEKSFDLYIKVSKEETAKKMGEHMKMDLSKKALKAVG